jgi:uncharacterized protein YndB with AHSA1/START domain
MKKPDFVYVTYIAATPEKVWQAFVDTDVMRQYWIGPGASFARVNVSDWKPGSPWAHQRDNGSNIIDIAGTVVECAPPSRLVLTWARPADVSDPSRHSRVAIDIEPEGGGIVRLKVTHDDLDAKMLEGISGGWPKILSNLKTLLETGSAMPRSAPAA